MTRGDLGVQGGVARVELDVARFDRDRAARGHRVAGIDHEVDEDLVELPRVGEQAPGHLADAHDEAQVLADELAEHGQDRLDRRTDLHDLRPDHLLAAEGEQLHRQPGEARVAATRIAEAFSRASARSNRLARSGARSSSSSSA